MVVMAAGVLSDYFLFCSSLCAQGPQLPIPLFNNLAIFVGTDGWQRGAVKIRCACKIIREMAFVASLARALIPKLELSLA